MKPHVLLSAIVAASITSGVAFAANVSPQGAAWLSYAVSDSNAEVQSCHMADAKTTNASIKSFCSRMISDHTKMASQGTQLGAQLGVTVKQSPPEDAVKAQHELQGPSGASFDRRFMQIQVQDHQKDIAKTRSSISAMTDPKLKSFAEHGLAILQTHLLLAKSTAGDVH